MDYASFIEGIDFRFLKPQQPRPKGFRGLAMVLRKAGVHLEVLNTRLPCDQKRIRRTLAPVCRVPRMSTFAIGAMIQQGVARMPDDRVFLNVGVWNGFTFLSGLAGNAHKHCIGVDLYGGPHAERTQARFLRRFERFRSPNHQFHRMDYKKYLTTVHKEHIGFYVYDGPHSYEDQIEGMRLAEPFVQPGAWILVDDTNTPWAHKGTMDFVAQSNHQYKILCDRRTPKGGHPTYWNGVIVLEKVS